MSSHDVIVIGQGFAGLSAARNAAEAGKRVLCIEEMFAGGYVMNVNELAPSPEPNVMGGSELVSNLAMANMDAGIEEVNAPVSGLERGSMGWTVKTDGGSFQARDVIVASGSRLRKLGVPGETEYFGRGVSECADCDGPMYGGKACVVVGGGDSAFQEALSLAHFAEKVTLVMRGDSPRARQELVDQVAASDRIELRSGLTPVAVEGDDRGVTGLTVNGIAGQETLPCAGVFVFIGLEPNTGFLPKEVELDERGAVVTDERCATAYPGLWAAGSVRSGFGGLLSDAAEDARSVVRALS